MSTKFSGITELILHLEKEGIEKNKHRKKNIIDQAHQRAENIIKKANENVKIIEKKCMEKCELHKKNLENELKIICRDFILKLSKTIKMKIIKPMIKENIKKSIDNNVFLINILNNIITNVMVNDYKNTLIIIDSNFKNEILFFFTQKIFNDIKKKKDIQLSFTNEFKGFKIIRKEEKIIWDFSLDSLTHEICELVESNLTKYFI